jgi:hypothetical protein
MRLRSGVGAGLLAVAVVAAVAVLRTHSAVPEPPAANGPDTQPAPAPVIDARAKQLTADFWHTTLLPSDVHFAGDPHNPSGFVFRRYIDTEVNHNLVRYMADGLLVRTADHAALDEVAVDIWRADGRLINAAALARCDTTEHFLGPSCTQQSFPNGVLAKVVRNSVFAQTAASDATSGSPPGLRSELQVAYPNGTLLTITLDSIDGAGIPLNDAAMLKLATLPGISGPR